MNRIRNSCKAVIRRGGDLLMIHCRDADGDFFILPGGGQEPGERMTETLVRECVEELGCPVVPGPLLYVCEYIHDKKDFEWQRSNHQIEYMFACALPEGVDPLGGDAPDDIQVGVEWVPVAAIAGLRHYPEGLARAMTGDMPVYWGDVT